MVWATSGSSTGRYSQWQTRTTTSPRVSTGTSNIRYPELAGLSGSPIGPFLLDIAELLTPDGKFHRGLRTVDGTAGDRPVNAWSAIGAFVISAIPNARERPISEITHARHLVRWIQDRLPLVDEDRHHPWLAEPPTPGALVAHIELRVRVPGYQDHATHLTLSAPLLDTDDLIPPQ